jgi:hypothetical protein
LWTETNTTNAQALAQASHRFETSAVETLIIPLTKGQKQQLMTVCKILFQM